MKVGICKFCGNKKELICAHIIPKSFYPADENGSRRQINFDVRGTQLSSQLQNGFFDSNLVCRKCEDLFNAGDNYAKNLLIDRRSEGVRKTDSGKTYFEYSNVDYKLIKLFFISLLWRAHATSLPYFQAVNIGANDEAIARTMICNKDPGLPDHFAVFMLRIADGPLGQISPSPTQCNFPPNNVCAYEFVLFGYIAYVKLGLQPFGSPFKDVQLAPGIPFRMLEREIERTPHFRSAKEAILKNDATKKSIAESRARGAK